MDETIDLLKLKIEKAQALLPADTIEAINAVGWQAAILSIRETKGYSFEQLGDLEIETELLLAGLVTPENYPKELEVRMKISKAAANELVNDMNDLVFRKIREELIKRTERKKLLKTKAVEEEMAKKDDIAEKDILSSAGIKILETPEAFVPAVKEQKVESPQAGETAKKEITLPVAEKLELKTVPELRPKTDDVGFAEVAVPKQPEAPHPILAQKLSGDIKIPTAKTEHTLGNISKTNTPVPLNPKPKIPSVDPYREIPE